jgi:tetratricopeptide (TPR) repeat protein
LSLDRDDEQNLPDLVQLLAGQRIDATGGLTVLDTRTQIRTWEKLRKQYPPAFMSNSEAVLVWHQEEAEEAEKAGDWHALGFHLDRLIHGHPKDWMLRARRARAHLQKEQWPEAAVNYEKAIKLGSPNGSVWYALALVQLQRDQTDDYRRVCAEMLKRFGKTKDNQVAEMAIRVCTLTPDTLADWGPLVELAEQQAPAKGSNQLLSPAGHGKVLYRAGRWQEAAEKLKLGTASARLFLAMAYYRLNRKEEARATLAEAIQWLEGGPAKKTEVMAPARQLSWNLKLEFRLLRQEAEAMLKEDRRR